MREYNRGDTAPISATTKNAAQELIDATTAKIRIIDGAGVEVVPLTDLTRISLGTYSYPYTIPADAEWGSIFTAEITFDTGIVSTDSIQFRISKYSNITRSVGVLDIRPLLLGHDTDILDDEIIAVRAYVADKVILAADMGYTPPASVPNDTLRTAITTGTRAYCLQLINEKGVASGLVQNHAAVDQKTIDRAFAEFDDMVFKLEKAEYLSDKPKKRRIINSSTYDGGP